MPNPIDPPPPEVLRPGDIVLHVHDRPGMEAEVVEVRPRPDGYGRTLLLMPWGENSAHFMGFGGGGTIWDKADFRLVRRPPPGQRIPREIPPEVHAGMTPDLALDFEFVRDVAEWISSGRVGADRINRLEHFKLFLAGHKRLDVAMSDIATNLPWPIESYEPAAGLKFTREVMGAWGTQEIFSALAMALTRLTTLWTGRNERDSAFRENRSARPVPFGGWCLACARESRAARPGSTLCPHFTCLDCGLLRAEACAVCTALEGQSRPVCTTCCTHRACACGCGANERLSQLCRSCSRVANHCACPQCSHMELADDEGDPDVQCTVRGVNSCCGQCAGHCNCSRQCFPLVKKPLKFHPAKRGDKVGIRRMLGTELETKDAKSYAPSLKAAVEKWSCSIVRDGSIGGRGMELVTAPAGGSNWVEMIHDLGVGFKDSQAITATSCGQHVHVDARDADVYAMRRVIQLYAALEESLFEALPSERRGSNYALLCGAKYMGWLDNQNKKLTKRWLAQKQYSIRPPTGDYSRKEANEVVREQIDERAKRKYDGTRYNALNLHSFWHRGTIEFRHAHGTNNPVQILNWGWVCGSIIDWCIRSSDAQLLKLLALEPRDALLSILPSDENREWLKSRWEKFAGPYDRDPLTGEV